MVSISLPDSMGRSGSRSVSSPIRNTEGPTSGVSLSLPAFEPPYPRKPKAGVPRNREPVHRSAWAAVHPSSETRSILRITIVAARRPQEENAGRRSVEHRVGQHPATVTRMVPIEPAARHQVQSRLSSFAFQGEDTLNRGPLDSNLETRSRKSRKGLLDTIRPISRGCDRRTLRQSRPTASTSGLLTPLQPAQSPPPLPPHRPPLIAATRSDPFPSRECSSVEHNRFRGLAWLSNRGKTGEKFGAR